MIYRLSILLFALLLSGCGHLLPSARDLAPPPVTLEGKTKPPPPADADLGLFEDVEAERAKMLEQLEAGTRVFNERMGGLLEGTQPRVVRPLSRITPVNGDLQEISFNFYDADLIEVVRLFMHLIGDSYAIHPGVSGRVSLSVEDTFNREQLLELLQGVLRIHGAAMVHDGQLWEILPLSEVPAHILAERVLLLESAQAPGLGQVIRAFRLYFISAEEMTNVIKPYLSKGAHVYADERLGILLVSDYPHALQKVAELLVLFDVSVFADVKARVYLLRYVAAEEAAMELEAIAQSFGLAPERGGPRSRVSFLPIERGNMLLVLTRDDEVMELLDIWVEQLDREIPEIVQAQRQGNVFVYHVQYGEAAEIVAILVSLFGGAGGAQRPAAETDGGDAAERRTSGLFGQSADPEGQENAAAGSERTAGATTAGPAEIGVTFVVDEQNNAILTRAGSAEYAQILAVIEQLDLHPRQVLIEVVIAEVQLHEAKQLGIEWRALLDHRQEMVQELSLDSNLGVITPKPPVITSGLSYMVTATDRLRAALKASAERGDARILSTPTLLASNNESAQINIGVEVPIPTSQRKRIPDRDVETIETTIQYRTTGIILDVLPRINKHGMVQMEISQEVSNISDRVVRGVEAPVINTRTASTTVSVNDQQTIVIGGLIQQTRSDTATGVPGLIRVPFLRYLFGYEKKRFENTELMLFITPHVILNEPDTVFVTNEFKRRLEKIKAEI